MKTRWQEHKPTNEQLAFLIELYEARYFRLQESSPFSPDSFKNRMLVDALTQILLGLGVNPIVLIKSANNVREAILKLNGGKEK